MQRSGGETPRDPGQTGLSGASERSESESGTGELGGGLGGSGDAGKTGVSGASERLESVSERGLGRGWVGDDGEAGKKGVSGASGRPSSESERSSLAAAFGAAGEAWPLRQFCIFGTAVEDELEVVEEVVCALRTVVGVLLGMLWCECLLMRGSAADLEDL